MKLSNIFTIASIILFATACGPSYDDYYYEDEYYQDEAYYEEEAYYEDLTEEEIAQLEREMGGAYNGGAERFAQEDNYNSRNNGGRSGGNLKTHTIMDPKTGRPSGYVQLPSNWRLTEKAWLGPGKTRVEFRKGGAFSAQQRQINSVDQIIQQDLLPKLQQSGLRLDRIIDLPSIAQNNQKMFAQYWKAMPSQETHQVKGIEMTEPNKNEKGLIIVHLTISRSQYGSFSNYYSNVLVSDPRSYENDKKIVINALSTMQMDRQAIAAHNQREQQKSNASWSAHNQRMRQNQANFDSWQKTQQTYSDISDINHEGWKRRNAISDAGHDKTINGIWERDAAVNPYSGQQMNVESGYKYYYMNANGQYFGTNDEFYNPERDPRVNHQQWRRVQRPQNNY